MALYPTDQRTKRIYSVQFNPMKHCAEYGDQ